MQLVSVQDQLVYNIGMAVYDRSQRNDYSAVIGHTDDVSCKFLQSGTYKTTAQLQTTDGVISKALKNNKHICSSACAYLSHGNNQEGLAIGDVTNFFLWKWV